MNKHFFYDGLRGRNGIGNLKGDAEEIKVAGPNGEEIPAILFELNGRRQEVVETRDDKYFKNGEEFWTGYYFFLPKGSGIGYGTLGMQTHTRVSDDESPVFCPRDREKGVTLEANSGDDIFIGHFEPEKWYRIIIRQVVSTSDGLTEVWIHDGENEELFDLNIKGGNLGKGSTKGNEVAYLKYGLYYTKGATGEILISGIGVLIDSNGYELLDQALPMSGTGAGSGGGGNAGGGSSGGNTGGGNAGGGSSENGSAIFKTFEPLELPRDITYEVSGKNIDAIAGAEVEGTDLVFITGKNNDRFTVSNFETGEEIFSKMVGSPNGLIVFGDEIHVTTTEGNREVKVFEINSLKEIYSYAGKPYLTDGEHDVTILINKLGEKVAYITDDSGSIFCFSFSSGSVFHEVETGIKKGLEELEAIPLPGFDEYDFLVVADENGQTGSPGFLYKVASDGIPYDPVELPGNFVSDREGIVAIPAPDGVSGYCIMTDQRKNPGSQFHVYYYDPSGFKHCGFFMVEGVTNTDGISRHKNRLLFIDDDTDGVGASLDLLFARTGLGFNDEGSGGGGNGGGSSGGEKTEEEIREEVKAELLEEISPLLDKIKDLLKG